jgi:DNA-binding response OmpR family regulator
LVLSPASGILPERALTGKQGNGLRAVPTEELADELRRRGHVVLDPAAACDLPGGAGAVRRGGRVVVYRGAVVHLTRREGQVLVALASGAPLTGAELTDAVWGRYADPAVGRFYARALRRKLPGLVAATRAGYCLAPESGA